MKLIFIYGPPAVGKLTVAEKLSELSGIPLFHNHVTRDLVQDIYGDGIAENYDLVRDIRNLVLSYCAKNDTDLIFTYVYGGAEDDEHVRKMKSSVEDNGGEAVFVELTAERADLLVRVNGESRKRYKKLHDAKILEKLTEDMEKFSIPFIEKTAIDTSKYSSDEVAKMIQELL